MPFIKFTCDPKLPRDLKHLGFRKDMVVNLSDDDANRWLRRGVAEIVPAPVAEEPAAPAAAEIVPAPPPVAEEPPAATVPPAAQRNFRRNRDQ